MVSVVQTYKDLTGLKDATQGTLIKVSSVEGMPKGIRKVFAQNCCDNFTFTYNASKKSWEPCILIYYIPWHIRELLETGELLVAPDASQTLIENLRRFDIKLASKEESCGPSSPPKKDPASSTPTQDAPSAQ